MLFRAVTAETSLGNVPGIASGGRRSARMLSAAYPLVTWRLFTSLYTKTIQGDLEKLEEFFKKIA